jgi:thiol:disulfide interchange protein DsbC
MMKEPSFMKKTVFCLMLAGLLPALMSCSANADNANVQAVKKAFHERFADREIIDVRTTPLKGIYEVDVQGNQIVYVDQKVDYMMIGDLIDVKNQTSLTEKRQSDLSQVSWNSLPLKDAIKEVRGTGVRKLAVFTDPDCPFCKRLERESLEGVTDVTIYTFLFPLTQLHPDALHKSKQIWCATDRAATWTAFMHDGKPLTSVDTCATPIERNLALGQKLGINGTPALIFANGHLVAGAIPKEQLEKALDAK